MLNFTFEYKLVPTAEQRQTFDRWLESARSVYNFALAERKDWSKSRSCRFDACSLDREYVIAADAPYPSFSRQCHAFAEAKKAIPKLREPHTHVLQQLLRQLDAAFVSMRERGHGYPRFKRKMRLHFFSCRLIRPFGSLFGAGRSCRGFPSEA